MLKIHNYSDDILHNITFEVTDNLVILGANGAGKSTLAKILCGITANLNVTLFNKPMQQYPLKQKTELINYIPSKFDIFDEYMNVEEFLQLSFIDDNRLSVDTILSLLDLEPLKTHSCKTLSSGESQLLLLASAIAHNAKITFLDEPTSNLDQQHIQKVFSVLKDQKYLNTKVIITHDLNFAFKLGYNVLFIDKGRVAFYGKNDDFFDEHNLTTFFNNSIKKVNDHIVSNL
jgi:iron complex transport system ATP-binding protein